MRIRETETVEVIKTEEKIIKDEVFCDMCNRKAEAPNNMPDGEQTGVNWTVGRGRYECFDFEVISVRRVSGCKYDYGDSGKLYTYEYHICEKCWEKLAGFIKMFRGNEPTMTSRNW